MEMHVLETPQQLGEQAAKKTAHYINEAIQKKGAARLLMSTGASQFDTISHLRKADIDWTKVEMFHLDEYIGVDATHPASFVKYLKERFVGDDIPLKATHYIDGTRPPQEVIAEITAEINKAPIDVALIGIGENAHIAFNDPPADFDTTDAFIIVNLDDGCKQQQVREGWFPTLDDVPKQAITISVQEILKCKAVISAVPHKEKAKAIHATVTQEVNNLVPATILKTHPDWTLYTDKASASLLDEA
ncbi:MAG: glucosamine-6-phosphate deaminase [Defluviitaleaceae bacterium]|nr:glucosamine-6-phosphate deaminase [Defluviitaleaceae bacterium]